MPGPGRSFQARGCLSTPAIPDQSAKSHRYPVGGCNGDRPGQVGAVFRPVLPVWGTGCRLASLSPGRFGRHRPALTGGVRHRPVVAPVSGLPCRVAAGGSPACAGASVDRRRIEGPDPSQQGRKRDRFDRLCGGWGFADGRWVSGPVPVSAGSWGCVSPAFRFDPGNIFSENPGDQSIVAKFDDIAFFPIFFRNAIFSPIFQDRSSRTGPAAPWPLPSASSMISDTVSKWAMGSICFHHRYECRCGKHDKFGAKSRYDLRLSGRLGLRRRFPR